MKQRIRLIGMMIGVVVLSVVLGVVLMTGVYRDSENNACPEC